MDKPELKPMTLREIVEQVRSEMRCNCDFDNWTPEQDTGHSWVCRIHKESKARYSKNPRLRARESEAGQ